MTKPRRSDFPPAVILAGGDGRRLGGRTKALIDLNGRRLIDIVRDRLSAQCANIALCVRSGTPWTDGLAIDVIHDAGDTAGPMAGVIAAMTWAAGRGASAVMTVPVDCPFVPVDLMQRLAAARTGAVDIAVAASNGRRHHLIALWPVRLAAAVTAHLADKPAMAVRDVQKNFTIAEVEWPCAPTDPFFNINTDADLAQARAIDRAIESP